MKQEPRYAYGRAVKTKCAQELYTIFVTSQLKVSKKTLGEHFFDNGFEKHRNGEGLEEHLFIVKKFVVSCTSPGLDIVKLVEEVRLRRGFT